MADVEATNKIKQVTSVGSSEEPAEAVAMAVNGHEMSTMVMSVDSTDKSAGAVAGEVHDTEVMLRMMNMCASWIYPAALRTIVQLDVPRILATNHAATNSSSHEGNVGMTAEEILQHVVMVMKEEQKHAEVETMRPNALNLERLMRLLTTKGIFAEHIAFGHDSEEREEGHNVRNDRVERRFSLTPLSRCLVPGVRSLHHCALLLTLGPEYAAALAYLGDSVLKSQEPFTSAHGMNQFEYMKSHPAFLAMLKNAFTDIAHDLLPMFLSKYRGFEDVQKLMDVGGSSGKTLEAVTNKYPHIHAINFDLPEVIASNPTLPGIEQVGGDMFEEVPSGCDAIFMKAILHDWNNEKCLQILKNCWAALPSVGGKLIMLDVIMPMETPLEGTHLIEQQTVFMADFMMQIHCASGRERSRVELEGLLKQARFTNFRVISKVGYCYIMEAFK